MFNRTILNRLVPLAVLAALFLAACNETPSETDEDVTQAREEASENISDARQDAIEAENEAAENVVDARQQYTETDSDAREDLTEAEADAMIKKAEADFDVAMAEAEGRHEIATEKCGVLDGVEEEACLSSAHAKFEAEKALAIANRDATLVAAAQHD